ncbi:hypothetical protein LI328DRAFT_159425 [Trichoderma asperelloides]|nr:hypothetical protein LI328DRAFT_159425 [Trichoderma asperelloides]
MIVQVYKLDPNVQVFDTLGKKQTKQAKQCWKIESAEFEPCQHIIKYLPIH